MKISKFIPFLLLSVFLSITSCSRALGYSMLLWELPEHNIQDGQIVKVYFKSNISHVYIVGIPGSKERYEVPLWQITVPASKKKTEKNIEIYKDYLHQYGKIKVDGLPVREEPVNTSK